MKCFGLVSVVFKDTFVVIVVGQTTKLPGANLGFVLNRLNKTLCDLVWLVAAQKHLLLTHVVVAVVW